MIRELALVMWVFFGFQALGADVSGSEYGRFVGALRGRVDEELFRCGGVLVARDLFLTAGHCVRTGAEMEVTFPRDAQVRVPKEVIAVAEVLESRFDPPGPTRGALGRLTPDIAILRLRQNVHVRRGFMEFSDELLPLAHGREIQRVVVRRDENRALQWVEQRCRSNELPRHKVRWFSSFPFLSYGDCASQRGDSGSPLILNGRVIGIHSNQSPRQQGSLVATSVACLDSRVEGQRVLRQGCGLIHDQEIVREREAFVSRRHEEALHVLRSFTQEVYSDIQWVQRVRPFDIPDAMLFVPVCVLRPELDEVRITMPMFKVRVYSLSDRFDEYDFEGRTLELTLKIDPNADLETAFDEERGTFRVPLCERSSPESNRAD